MLRVFKTLAVCVLLLTALLAAVPAQAAEPGGVAWQSLISWWESWTAWLTVPDEPPESALSVAVGTTGPSISINGLAPPEEEEEEGGTEATAQTTIDPDELPTEEGPRILPDG